MSTLNIHTFLFFLAITQVTIFSGDLLLRRNVENKYLKALIYFIITILTFYTLYLLTGFSQR